MQIQKRYNNALVADQPSDSDLKVSLHPLVLLTITDHLTRRQVRGQSGILIGALLGQQHDREVTIEHGFECSIEVDGQGQAGLQPEWFEDRLQQYQDVHKDPPLELVGWYTLCPESGPNSAFLPIQEQITAQNDSALLLAFHPSGLGGGSGAKGVTCKLPLTIYETIHESESTQQREDSMQIDEESASSGIRYCSIPYSIETTETEMIAVDYVAKGGGNAAAGKHGGLGADVGSTQPNKETSKTENNKEKVSVDNYGVSKEDKDDAMPLPAHLLTADEEDQIAGITTRLNSVRMLQLRLALLSTYITSVIASTSSSNSPSPSPSSLLIRSTPDNEHTTIDPTHLPHLRNIKALLGRLSLLSSHSEIEQPDIVSCQKQQVSSTPSLPNSHVNPDSSYSSNTYPSSSLHGQREGDSLQAKNEHKQQTPTAPSVSLSFSEAQQRQSNDATLSSLLATLEQDIHSLAELGRKFSVVESGQQAQAREKEKGFGGKKGTGGWLSGLKAGKGGNGSASASGVGGIGVGETFLP